MTYEVVLGDGSKVTVEAAKADTGSLRFLDDSDNVVAAFYVWSHYTVKSRGAEDAKVDKAVASLRSNS